jgi:hypothetical protein
MGPMIAAAVIALALGSRSLNGPTSRRILLGKIMAVPVAPPIFTGDV